jgi:cysteine-rich repeat protein
MISLRIRRSHLRLVGLLVAIGALLVGGGTALGALSSSSSSADVIHACAQKQTGSLRVVESASDCKSNETPIEWSRNGPIPVPQACPAGQFVTGLDANGALTCSAPTATAFCGDGVVQTQNGEQCDAGGVDSATCNINCTFTFCGDGRVNHAAGEECDDGNTVNGDGCSNMCKIER